MMKKRGATILILFCAFWGIAVTAYIARSSAAGVPLICDVAEINGCNTVVASAYGKVFGVPLADYGLLFYTIVFVLAAFELALANQLLRHSLQGFAAVGLLVSGYGFYTQAFILEAYCVYCLASVALTIIIGLAATLIEPLPTHLLKKKTVSAI